MPLNELPRRLHELPLERPVIAVCESGYRSCIAASLLERAGVASVGDFAGGMAGWERAE